MPTLPRGLSVPTIAAAAVTLVGALLVLLGVLQATVLAPSPTIASATSQVSDLPAVVVRPQELEPDAQQVRIQVTAPAGRPVFIGVGRVRDVEEYLAQAARYDVTADGDGELTTVRRGGEATMPNPASVDVWAARARGTEQAELVWLKAPGQWAAVVATDGTSQGPASVTFTWTTGESGSSVSPALVAIGALLLVGGGVLLVLLWTRSRQDGDGDGDGDGAGGYRYDDRNVESYDDDYDSSAYDPEATRVVTRREMRAGDPGRSEPDRGAASPFASPYAPTAPPAPWRPRGDQDDEKGTDQS